MASEIAKISARNVRKSSAASCNVRLCPIRSRSPAFCAAAGSPRYPNSLLRVCAVFSIFSRSPVSTACAKLASCFGVSVNNICTNSHKGSSSPCNRSSAAAGSQLTMIRQVQTLLALREPRVPCHTTWRSFLLRHWLESASLRSLCESFLLCSASPRSGSWKARQRIPHRRNLPRSHRIASSGRCGLLLPSGLHRHSNGHKCH